MDRQPCVHILASDRNGTRHVDVMGPLYQHRSGDIPGFTSRYGVTKLVRFELFGDMLRAIAREKQLKNWRREWKLNLIEQDNPQWNDLAVELGFDPPEPR